MPHEPYSEVLDRSFSDAIDMFDGCTGMRRFRAGELTAEHYASLLREIYFHTREMRQVQALAAVFLRGARKAMIDPTPPQDASRVGHEQLPLNDMTALGHDVTALPAEQPLPATIAVTAFPFYQITNLNPIGYLGYLYFLEAMPTTFGAEYMRILDTMGVPREAMSFLYNHSAIELGHTRLLKEDVSELIRSEADLEATCHAMRVTAELYGRMLTDAVAEADQRYPATEARSASA